MRVLIWHEDIESSTKWQTAFGRRGHDVRRSRTAEDAMDRVRKEPFDLLLFDLLVREEGGLGVALMAEFHQPGIASVLITSREPELHNDMFARLSSLRCVLGCQTPVDDLVAIAEGIAEGPEKGCKALSEDLPQLCGNCQIRSACLRGEEVPPMFRHRDMSPASLAAGVAQSGL
ncbi:hypothetical protein [Celeribacter ethanolicus]|uniref:hypothetical protein n=1 Tax=Celeribacter ethanolicus TaxID=1758178 RepID=UPI000835826D|nr:hypothetical protein [Celeribacter ethanolicus]TNE69046.1 MAG: hypothetical protein EP336_03495 [Paracoccaceae bacterium]